jgi:hypothetical protein
MKEARIVRLGQESCKFFKDGLVRYRRTNLLAFSLLPLVKMDSVGGTLDSIGRWVDKMFTVCAAIIILLLVLFILWILSQLSGRGGQRG